MIFNLVIYLQFHQQNNHEGLVITSGSLFLVSNNNPSVFAVIPKQFSMQLFHCLNLCVQDSRP